MNYLLKLFGGGDSIYALCLGYVDTILSQWNSVCISLGFWEADTTMRLDYPGLTGEELVRDNRDRVRGIWKRYQIMMQATDKMNLKIFDKAHRECFSQSHPSEEPWNKSALVPAAGLAESRSWKVQPWYKDRNGLQRATVRTLSQLRSLCWGT